MQNHKREAVGILLVEDNAGDANLIREFLSDENSLKYELTRAATLTEGLKLLKVGKFNVVLLDLTLPDSSGIDTLRRVIEVSPDVPVLVQTSLEDDGLIDAALHLGAQDYLSKEQLTGDLLERCIRYAIDRKKAELKLKQAAAEWKTTFDSIADPVSIHDRKFGLVQVNKAFARKFGKKPSDFINKTCYQVVHGTDKPPSYCPNLKLDRNGKPESTEYYLSSDDCVLESVWPVFNDAGKMAASVHIMRDITESKKAEEALRKSEKNFRNSVDNLPLGVAIITEEGKMVYASKAFLDLYGYDSPEELGNIPLCKRYTPESYEKHLERRKNFLLGQAVLKSYDLSIVRKNGELRHLHVHWADVLWDGKPRVQLLYQDITERKNMQEQLIITDRLASVGELAAGVAHELNNPLTGVIGFSQLLLDRDIPEGIREDVEIIYREARRSSEVVKNLLAFARKHAPVNQLSNLNEVIGEVLQLRAYEQKVNNINVETNYDSELPHIMGDPFQLQQVFLNIILNAEHSMIDANKGGVLTITTEVKGKNVLVFLTDNGPGIKEEAVGHLFDPFFTTKEVGKGTGLGLSICHGIVNEHNGHIYAESKKGEGATFIIKLPVASNKLSVQEVPDPK